MRDRKTVEAMIKGETERAVANINAEAGGQPRPEKVFWLSFAQGKFLGAVVIHAVNFSEAVARTHLLGINPGGQVMGAPLPPADAKWISEKWKNKLLTRAECDEVGKEMQATMCRTGDLEDFENLEGGTVQ